MIYGLTTILARLLNFALTPLHTSQIDKADYRAGRMGGGNVRRKSCKLCKISEILQSEEV